jgi:hypothetical protein
MYHALSGVELTFQDISDMSNRKHALQFFICEQERFVSSNAGTESLPKKQQARDFGLALLPFYRQTLLHRHPSSPSGMGYISHKDKVTTLRGHVDMQPINSRNRPPQVHCQRVTLISPSFDNDTSLHVGFRSSEWPGNEEQLRELLKDAIESFITS